MWLAGWRANFSFGSDAGSINAAVWAALRDVVTSYSPGDYDDYISALDRDPNAVADELEKMRWD